ncbi:MAG: hypothetical protein KDK25_02295 [Leptospiraceae bacterium]|nr:hypothetical protein [Leptospiraceae bacterium]
MSEWERDALKRMENRFSLSPEEESPFKHLELIHKQVIRGSHFLAYKGDQESEPICIYSEKNRFRGVLKMLLGSWAADLTLLLELLLKAEKQELDTYEEEELDTFGLRVNEDSYVVGYLTGGSSPIVATKDLLLQILQFYLDAMEALSSEGSLKQCRQTLYDIRQQVQIVGEGGRDGHHLEERTGTE